MTRRPFRLGRIARMLVQSTDKLGFFPVNRKDVALATLLLDALWSYDRFLAATPSVELIVLENTHDHLMLISAARRRGIGVICVPHDTESLTNSSFNHDQPLSNLRPFWTEIRALGEANHFFSISFEEQWLLRGFGVPAEHLPFYPATEDRGRLEQIRNLRRGEPKNSVLVLGTAGHLPTGRGMREVLGYLSSWQAPLGQGVVVAGYQTESLRSFEGGPGRVRVLGAVSDETLTQLLTSARAAVVHQFFGCGALTRIPELLIAGVPVIANTIAARSYRHLDGVYTYTTADELYELLSTDLPDPPPLSRPRAEEDRFVEALRKYTRQS